MQMKNLEKQEDKQNFKFIASWSQQNNNNNNRV